MIMIKKIFILFSLMLLICVLFIRNFFIIIPKTFFSNYDETDSVYLIDRHIFTPIRRGDIIIYNIDLDTIPAIDEFDKTHRDFYTDRIVHAAGLPKEYKALEIPGRVVGLPKDKVEILNGKIAINGTILEESYIKNNLDTYAGEFLDYTQPYYIKENEYFVLWDDRKITSPKIDSRSFGGINKNNIKGKLIRCILYCDTAGSK